jgi:hypothetical protein
MMALMMGNKSENMMGAIVKMKGNRWVMIVVVERNGGDDGEKNKK